MLTCIVTSTGAVEWISGVTEEIVNVTILDKERLCSGDNNTKCPNLGSITKHHWECKDDQGQPVPTNDVSEGENKI